MLFVFTEFFFGFRSKILCHLAMHLHKDCCFKYVLSQYSQATVLLDTGPPKQGTAKYKRYLVAQKLRKQKARLAHSQKKAMESVMTSASFKRLVSDYDLAVRRSNRHFRALATAQSSARTWQISCK